MAERELARRGSVLVIVLVLMLALELLAHGALLMATQEEAASRAGKRLLQGRLAAEEGLRDHGALVGVAFRDAPLQGVVPVGRGTLGDGRYRVVLRRLARERWLADSEGWVEGVAWRIRVGALAWLPDPVARLQAFGGVLVVGRDAPVELAGAVETGTVRSGGPGDDPMACAPWRAELDSLYGAGLPDPLARTDALPHGEPSLGPLGPEEILAWLGAGSGGGGGARAARGDLTLRGEVGEGLLVVEGDLELVGGRHEGLLLVGGHLTLRDGAVLVGFARAAGGVTVEPDAQVVGSGCLALRALADGLEGWVRPLIRADRAFPMP